MSNRILELLSSGSGQYVSGELLSRELGISRTAIWKQIKKLEVQGYVIEASPRLGYRLAGKPSKLTMPELMEHLRDTSIVSSIKLFESVDSTQNIAHRLAEEGAPSGTLVIAEQQTSGRGRMGRQWVSPSGKGIYMSMVLRPDLPLQFAPQLTLLTAVALCRALKEIAPLPIGIKWPNDLLIEGKKISGILLESAAEDERLRHVIMGIGISVNLTEDDYPEELLPIATSLRIASGGEPLDRAAVIASFMKQFEHLYAVYISQGFSPIQTLWEALSVTLHKPTKLMTPQGVVEGIPVALNDSGALLVRLGDGREMPIFSAESMRPPQG
ncbi:BirA family biotin operon repressor/biotin-[acetyl-CoA-carboxylase] ligase [Paenibacillus phyllosphaerae]|uniref:Bifunctional ligase/repressor BirA n=1 Tax=Paenibacillus phyllosphaerae TaxID=274593 RepID=A0A7W5FLR6_9BACL|nr:biotin--[acetyl-CoA-carboxylase] ligase [Paenibacillus phyllosphaerae]MBB3109317.1 BirA family biotin operon repressor/biotin-[acetyl-CoA-carboxylase] ligase [Paenibacillus phyllosphaerae]